MHKSLVIGAITLALTAGTAFAASHSTLKFAPGEDAKFNWKSYEDFKAAHDLEGQTLSIFGPWRGED